MKKRAAGSLALLLSVAFAAAQGDYQKGVSYYQQNQYNKAIAEFEPIVQEQKDYEFGHRILGFCYLKTKQYDKAVASLREAIRLKGDNFSSYRALALAYFNSGSYQQVISTLDRAEALAKSPRDKYEVYRTRGSAAFNVGNFSQASADLEKAVSIQRGDADDVLQLGIAYYQQRQYEKASQYLQQALALDPSQESAQRYLSRVGYQAGVDAIENGRYKEAAKILREYVDKRPEEADGWFNLGLAYLFADSLSAAEESFLRCLKLGPENGAAHARLGYIYEKKKQYSKALDHYEKAARLGGGAEAKKSVERVRLRIQQAQQ